MKRLLILFFAASVSAPVLAQHQGHTMPMPSGARTAQPARPTARQPARAARPAARRRAAQPASSRAAQRRRAPAPAARRPADPHAGHAAPPAAPARADPHAGHAMPAPAAPADPHAGHAMPSEQTPATSADPHADHQMGDAQTMADPPVAPPPPAALSGPAHAADSVFTAPAMDEARDIFRREHGEVRTHRVLIDQLEARIQNGRDGYAWDAQAWYGGAIDRLWIKTEGEGEFGERPERAEVQALWSHALDPWFNLQAGVRYDFRPDPERGYLVLGIEGLAPHWFEVDGALFLSDRGDLSARIEGEYDLRITQRLILQPRLELDFALQDDAAILIGSGLSTTETGLRLRYEIVPEFAPYVGVQYGRAFGDTARFRRAAGEDVGGWSLLLGVRAWF